MARIDLYVNNLERYGASGLRLVSGGNVCMRFPSGNRLANQVTPHDELILLVNEIAPAEIRAALEAGDAGSFDYAHQARPYTVLIAPSEGGVEVLVAPGGGVSVDELRAGLDEPAAAAPGGAGLASIPLPASTKKTAPAQAAPAAVQTTPAAVRATPAAAQPVAAPAPAKTTAKGPSSRPVSEPSPRHGKGGWIEGLLIEMHELGASDLHLTSGAPPYLRLHGEMTPLTDRPACTPEQILSDLTRVMPEKNRHEFETRNDTDFAYAIEGVSRFRGNAFRDRKGPGAVFRSIPFEIMSPDQLGLPKGVLELCALSKGLVLVTGPTGSGKSTTLATLINHCNSTRMDHIITVEDPIEFVHESRSCLVNQREVHSHTGSFRDALRAALREDPDIVLVGEMRDLETIAIAVETAETGHLVFGTLHTNTAPSTVDRIIDQFPPDRQEQIRQMLAESLRGVISQNLCRKADHSGRVAAYEILLGHTAVSNLIRERKTFQLYSLMQTNRAAGMMTLNDSLLDLVKKGAVEAQEALLKSVNKVELRSLLSREGVKLD